MPNRLQDDIKNWVRQSEPPVTADEVLSRPSGAPPLRSSRQRATLAAALLVLVLGAASLVAVLLLQGSSLDGASDDEVAVSPRAAPPHGDASRWRFSAPVETTSDGTTGELVLGHLSGKTITLSADADLLDGTVWVRPLLRLREPQHLLIHLQHADGEAAIGERCRLGAQSLLEAHVRLPNDPRTPRDTCRSTYSRSLPNDALEWFMADITSRYSVLDLGSRWVLPLEAGETQHAEALAAGLVVEDVGSGLPQVTAVDDSVSIDADLSQLQAWIVAPDGAVTELTIWPTCDLGDMRWARDEEGERTEQYSCVGDGAALVDEWPRAETLPDAPVPDEWASLTITVD